VPGQAIVVNPDDAHDGGPAERDGVYSYRMLYVEPDAFEAALDEAAGRRVGAPFFAELVVDDVDVARRLLAMHRTLERAETRLEQETALIAALVALARRHGRVGEATRGGLSCPRPVALARDYLREHFAENCSLSALAELAGDDRFQLLRAFRRALGLPPHSYQTQLRLRCARRLLLAGAPPAMAAAAAGFADQSHLTRRFKAAFGITPGAVLRSRAEARGLTQ